MERIARRIVSVSFVLLTVLVMSIPVAGVMGITGSARAAEPSYLRIGMMQKIDSLNPMAGLSDSAYVFYGLVYDCLQSVGNDLNSVGNLATEWRQVPATDPELIASGEPVGSVWEFDITQNAYWHDGTQLTVDDVVFTVNLNSENYDVLWAYQPYAYFMNYAEAVDSETVRIHFFDRDTGVPMPSAYTDFISMFVLPKHLLDTMSADEIANEWEGVFDGEPTSIVGTGPFMATETLYEDWSLGNPITLVRNPSYHWEEDKQQSIDFDGIVMRFYESPSTMSLALKTGELDVAQLPPEQYVALKEEISVGTVKDIDTYEGLKCTQYFTEIGINMNLSGPNPARLDPAVRAALATATDKQSIIDSFYHSYAEVGTTLISPINEAWHYEPTAGEQFTYDLSAAAQMLEDAGYRYPNANADWRVATVDSRAVAEGWVTPNTDLRFQMYVRRETPEERDIALFLKDQWAQIGVDLNYLVVDEEDLAEEIFLYEYDMMIWYWSADVDPNYMLFCQSQKSWYGWNDNMYYNESYEENYTASVSEMGYSQRMMLVDNCQRTNYLDAAYIILAYPYQTYAWRTDTFTGWGDWEADPGRSIDNFWSANPLYFDLETADGGISMLLVGGGIAIAAIAAVAGYWFFFLKKKDGKKAEEKKT